MRRGRTLDILPRTVGVRAAACALLSPEGRHGTSPKAAAGVCSACLDTGSLSPRKTAASARCRLGSLIRASVPMPNRRAEGPERRSLAGGELEIKVRRSDVTAASAWSPATARNCGCCSSNGPPVHVTKTESRLGEPDFPNPGPARARLSATGSRAPLSTALSAVAVNARPWTAAVARY